MIQNVIFVYLWWFLHLMKSVLWCVQFASSGHTQLPGNAIMITSTITIVLFTTVVRDLIPLRLKVLNFGLLSSTCHNLQFMLFKHSDFYYWVNVVKLLIEIWYMWIRGWTLVQWKVLPPKWCVMSFSSWIRFSKIGGKVVYRPPLS